MYIAYIYIYIYIVVYMSMIRGQCAVCGKFFFFHVGRFPFFWILRPTITTTTTTIGQPCFTMQRKRLAFLSSTSFGIYTRENNLSFLKYLSKPVIIKSSNQRNCLRLSLEMNLFQASGAQLKETTTNEMGRLSLESQKNSEKVVHLSLQDETVPSHTLETGANRAVRKRSTPRKTQNKEYKSRANNSPKEDLLHSVTNSTLVEEVTQIPSDDAIREPEAEDLKRIEQEFCLEKLFSKGRSKENWKRHSSLSGLCDEKDNRRNGVDRKERNEKTEKEEDVGDMLANGW